MTGPIQLPSAGNAGADPQSSSTSSVPWPTHQTESNDPLAGATMASVPTSEQAIPTIAQIEAEWQAFISGEDTLELSEEEWRQQDETHAEMERFMSGNGAVTKSDAEAEEYDDDGRDMVMDNSPENPTESEDKIAATWREIERELGGLSLPPISRHTEDHEIPFA